MITEYGIYKNEFKKLFRVKTNQSSKGYGLVSKQELILQKKTYRIPGELGCLFGVKIDSLVTTDCITVKILHSIMEHPESNYEFDNTEFSIVLEKGNSMYILFCFEHNYEILLGFWSIQIWQENEILSEQEFEVFSKTNETTEEENYFYDM